MALIYQVKNTNGSATITVVPQEINGSNKAIADSDINLIGQGATIWGESLNESLYRIVEHFACEQKILGDFLPGTDNPNDFPPGAWAGNGSYDPTIHPVMPKDEMDLGVGLGINAPIPGQIWFNTDINKASVYSGISSTFQSVNNVTIAATVPASPQNGDLWYDSTISQLKIYNGVSFISVADRYLLLDGTAVMTGDLDMGGNFINNVADITTGAPGSAGANKNYVELYTDQEIVTLTSILTGGLLDPQYVNITGDTMTGNLSVTNGTNTPIIIIDPASNANGFPQLAIRNSAGITQGILFLNDANGRFTLSQRDGAGGPLGDISFDSITGVAKTAIPTGGSPEDIARKDYVDAAAAVAPGTVQLFAGAAAPTGFLLCNGADVSRTTYASLYALIGTTFGSGNGSTTFNVPDFRGRLPGGVGTTSPVPSNGSGSISLAQKLGQWFSRLTSVNQLPAHDHGGGNHYHGIVMGGGSSGPRSAIAIDTWNNTSHSYPTPNRTAYSGNTILSQGISQVFSTYPPILGINFIIKT